MHTWSSITLFPFHYKTFSKKIEDCSHALIFKGFWLIKFYLFKLAEPQTNLFSKCFCFIEKRSIEKKFFLRNIDIKKGSPQIQIKSHIYNVIRDD